MSWAAAELEGVALGDKRRKHESAGESARDLTGASKGRGGANGRVEAVLAIQDTSELDYSEHRKGTRGLGPISDAQARGMKVHSVIAVSDEGVPLGVLHQQMWSREIGRGVPKSRRQRGIEEKESVRWLESLEETERVIPETVEVVTIADREADIYELFAYLRRGNSELLIRAAQNRNTKRSEYSEEVQPLFEVIAGSVEAGAESNSNGVTCTSVVAGSGGSE